MISIKRKLWATTISMCLLSSIQAIPPYRGGGRVAVGNRNVNVNRNANVNQNVNVNRNVNVNVNRNVNVHGGYYGPTYYHDDYNWGAFAAGAAVGVATTAVVAAATRPSTTVVVAPPPPAIGTVIGVLPTGCAAVAVPGSVVYNCSNVYYSPFYQGTVLSYRVVKYP
jgi:hypothetical protein